jgi:hypothetical protein
MEDSHDYIKTYATFYVNECDEFDYAKKIEMLNVIHHASESMMIELFETGEIPSPLILDEVDDFDALMFEADYLSELIPTGKTSLGLPGLPGVSMDDITGSLNKIKKFKGLLVKKYNDADQAVKDAIKNKIDKANDKINMLQHKISGSPKPKTGLDKAVEGGKEIMTQAKDKVVGAAEKVGKAVGKAAEYAGEHPGKTAAAAVAAAAVLTAGVMAYRRFISKAGRACKDSADKPACKREYHNKGLQAQMTVLSAGKAKCFKGKNPDKCKAKIDVKIAQVKNKMKG